MRTLLKNGTAVLPSGEKKCDILIEDGRIARIVPQIQITGGAISGETHGANHVKAQAADKNSNQVNDIQIIDCTGKHILPGLIDIHVHLREPGFEGKEDIQSGCAAAVKGGVTQVCCMPNTDPVCDNAVVVTYIKTRAEQAGLCKVHPIGAITKGEKGETLSDIGKMKSAGAVALSDDGKSVMDSRIMRLAMEYASDFSLKCLCHCEDASLADGGSVNEGYNATVAGLKGIPRAAEDIMIARDIALAESLGVPVHICHVSTYSGVEIIRSAKARGVKVTAETCPHYFILTDDIITGYDTFTKVNPPVREQKDVEAIIKGLKDGTLDCIVTDHAPHALKDKQVEYALAACGISGIETSLALSYTYLVKTGKLTLCELMQKMSANPAAVLGLRGGELKEGEPADVTVVDFSGKYVIDGEKFVSKGKNTPFNGFEVYGVVNYTFVDGDLKYKAD